MINVSKEKRESHANICPVVEQAFLLLGKKWVGLILHTLSGGPLHFCELERVLRGLSARMLSHRVKELEEKGLVERKVYTGNPVRVTYGLTEKGKDLIPVLTSFVAWARRWEKSDKKENVLGG
ncbi:MAG: helix-turn-helix transcriptional regulator [Spirochaetes bacterium]|nr:helix-turn-helix transcriptional regulator [Spirochaetota bacterium]